MKTENTLKIKGVTQDVTDPQRLRFVLQFTRDMTPIEREFVPQAITLKMGLPTEELGPDKVMIGRAAEGWFTLPQHRKTLKAAVADAEEKAKEYLSQVGAAEGRRAAIDQETRLKLEAIDWDDDSE